MKNTHRILGVKLDVVIIRSYFAIIAFSVMSIPTVRANPHKSTGNIKPSSVKSLPAPPPLIAPSNLRSEEDMLLTPTQAEEKEKSFKVQADEEYARGDYRNALVSLQRAYLISKKARYIANQGLVLEKMQRYSDAIKALEYYLLTKPPSSMARSAQQVINRLRPEVKIETDPPGANIILNHEVLGKTPYTFRLIAGEHPLELSLKGYDARSVTLFVIPGKPVFAQYKLDQSISGFALETNKLTEPPMINRKPMNTLQSGGVLLGGITLALSATSFWFTRSAIVERNQALNQTSWEVAQSEVELFNSMTYVTASIGVTTLISALSWWLLTEPVSTTPVTIGSIKQSKLTKSSHIE